MSGRSHMPPDALETAAADLAKEVAVDGVPQLPDRLTPEALTAYVNRLFGEPGADGYRRLMTAYATRMQLNRLRVWVQPNGLWRRDKPQRIREEGVMQTFYEYVPSSVVHYLTELQNYLRLRTALAMPVNADLESKTLTHLRDLSTVINLRTLLGRYGQLIELRNEMRTEHGADSGIVRNLNVTIAALKAAITARFGVNTAHTPGGSLRIRTPAHKTTAKPTGTRPAGANIEVPVTTFISADIDNAHYLALRQTNGLLDLEINWLMSGIEGVPGYSLPQENPVISTVRDFGILPQRELLPLPPEQLNMDLLERALVLNVQEARKIAAAATESNRTETQAALKRLSDQRQLIIAETVAMIDRMGKNRMKNVKMLSLRGALDAYVRGPARSPVASGNNTATAAYLEKELKDQIAGIRAQMSAMLDSGNILTVQLPEAAEDLFNSQGRQAAWRTMEALVVLRLTPLAAARKIPGAKLIGDIPYVGEWLGLEAPATRRATIMKEIRVALGYPEKYDPLLSEEENRTKNNVTLTPQDKARIREKLKSTLDVLKKYRPLFDAHKKKMDDNLTALTDLRQVADPDSLLGVEPATEAQLRPHLVGGRVTPDTVVKLKALPDNAARKSLCMAAFIKLFAQCEGDWQAYTKTLAAYLGELEDVLKMHLEMSMILNRTSSSLTKVLATLGGAAFLWWVGGRGGLARFPVFNSTLRWGRIPMRGPYIIGTLARGLYRMGNGIPSLIDRALTAGAELAWSDRGWGRVGNAAKKFFWDPQGSEAAAVRNLAAIQRDLEGITVAAGARVRLYSKAFQRLSALELEAGYLAPNAARNALLQKIAAARTRILTQGLEATLTQTGTSLRQKFDELRVFFEQVDKTAGAAGRLELVEAVSAARARLITAGAQEIPALAATGDTLTFFRAQAARLSYLESQIPHLSAPAQVTAQMEVATARYAVLRSLTAVVQNTPSGAGATAVREQHLVLLALLEEEAALLPVAQRTQLLNFSAQAKTVIGTELGVNSTVARAALTWDAGQRSTTVVALLRNSYGGAEPVLRRLGFTSLKQFTDLIERVHLLRHEELLREYAALDKALAAKDAAAVSASRGRLIEIFHAKINELMRAGVSEELARDLVRRGICGVGDAAGSQPLITGTGGLASAELQAVRAARLLESSAATSTLVRLSPGARSALSLLGVSEQLAILRAVRMSPHLTAYINGLVQGSDELLCSMQLLRSPGIRTALAGLTSEAEVAIAMRGMMAMEAAQIEVLAARLAGASTAARPAMLLEAATPLAGTAPRFATVRWLIGGAGKLLLIAAPIIEGVMAYGNYVEYQRLREVRSELEKYIASIFPADKYEKNGYKYKHKETEFEVDTEKILTISDDMLSRAMVDTGVAIGATAAASAIVLYAFLASNPVGWVIAVGLILVTTAKLLRDEWSESRRNAALRTFLADLDPRLLQVFSLEQVTGLTYSDINKRIGWEVNENRAWLLGMRKSTAEAHNESIVTAREVLAINIALMEIRRISPVSDDMYVLPDGRGLAEILFDKDLSFRRHLLNAILPDWKLGGDELRGNQMRGADGAMRLVLAFCYRQWSRRYDDIQRGALTEQPGESGRIAARLNKLGGVYLGKGLLIIDQYLQYRARNREPEVRFRDPPQSTNARLRREDAGALVGNADRILEYDPLIRSHPCAKLHRDVGMHILLNHNEGLAVERDGYNPSLDSYKITIREDVHCFFAFIGGQWMWSATNWPLWRRVGTALYSDNSGPIYQKLNRISTHIRRAEDLIPGVLTPPPEGEMGASHVETLGASYLVSKGATTSRSVDGRTIYALGEFRFLCLGGRWFARANVATSAWTSVSGWFSTVLAGEDKTARQAIIDLEALQRAPELRKEKASGRHQLGIASLSSQTLLRPVEFVPDRFGIAAYSVPVNGNKVYFAFTGGRWHWNSTDSPRWYPVAEARYDNVPETDDRHKANRIAIMLNQLEHSTVLDAHVNTERNEKTGLSLLLSGSGLRAVTRVAPAAGTREPVRYALDLGGGRTAYFAFIGGRWCWNDTGHPRWSSVSQDRYDFTGMTDRHRAANAVAQQLTEMENGMTETVPPRPDAREQLGIASLYAQTHLGPVTFLPDHLGTPAYRIQADGYYVYFAFFGGMWHWNSTGNPRWWLAKDARYSRENGGETPTDSRYKANQIAIMLAAIEKNEQPEPHPNPERNEKTGISILLSRTGLEAVTRVAPAAGTREPVRYALDLGGGRTAYFAFIGGRWCWNDTGHPRWSSVSQGQYDFTEMTDRFRAANAVARRLMTMEAGMREPDLPRPDQREDLGVTALFSQNFLRPVTFLPDYLGTPAYRVPVNDFYVYFAFFGGMWHWGSSGTPRWWLVSEDRYRDVRETDDRHKANQIAIMLTAIENRTPVQPHPNIALSGELGTSFLLADGFTQTVPPGGIAIFERTVSGVKMQFVCTEGRWFCRYGDDAWVRVQNIFRNPDTHGDAPGIFNRVTAAIATMEGRPAPVPLLMPSLVQTAGVRYLSSTCGVPRLVNGLTVFSRTMRDEEGNHPWTVQFTFAGGRWLWKDAGETQWGHVGRPGVYKGTHPAVAAYNGMRDMLVALEGG